jgi:hypothetical protein
MGSSKQVHGFYPTTPEWVPIQVDANGKVVIDPSVLAGYSKVVWKDAPDRALSDLNRVASLAYTVLDLTAYTSANAKFAIGRLVTHIDNWTSGSVYIDIRKNGTAPAYVPSCYGTVDAVSGNFAVAPFIIGLDAGQVIEYQIFLGGVAQVDSYIDILGYIE